MNLISRYITKQLSEIWCGGCSILIRKLKKIQIRISITLISFGFIPFILLMRALSPLILIRFFKFHNLKIGHHAGDTELHLCVKQHQTAGSAKKKYFYIYFNQFECSANKELERLWKRDLFVIPWLFGQAIERANRYIPGYCQHEVSDRERLSRDVLGLLSASKMHVTLTEDEKYCSEQVLRLMGIPEGGRIVCLLVRDSYYFEKVLHHNNDEDSYRDSSISNFNLAVQELTQAGYYVVRMGAIAKEWKIDVNDKVIDYANNPLRSEFMDIYLGYICQFFISTGSGWDSIPQILFRKPGVFVNFLPLAYIHSFSEKCIFHTKDHYSIATGEMLTLTEIIKSGAAYNLRTSDFEKHGIGLKEGNPEDIRDLVREMIDRLDHVLIYDDIDTELQRKFWNIFSQNINKDFYEKHHGQILSKFSKNYLRKNQWWLE